MFWRADRCTCVEGLMCCHGNTLYMAVSNAGGFCVTVTWWLYYPVCCQWNNSCYMFRYSGSKLGLKVY